MSLNRRRRDFTVMSSAAPPNLSFPRARVPRCPLSAPSVRHKQPSADGIVTFVSRFSREVILLQFPIVSLNHSAKISSSKRACSSTYNDVSARSRRRRRDLATFCERGSRGSTSRGLYVNRDNVFRGISRFGRTTGRGGRPVDRRRVVAGTFPGARRRAETRKVAREQVRESLAHANST